MEKALDDKDEPLRETQYVISKLICEIKEQDADEDGEREKNLDFVVKKFMYFFGE